MRGDYDMTKLSYGSYGDSVRQLQQALNGKGYNVVP